MSITAIYVDLDGVLADFVSSALEAHDQDPSEKLREWPPGEYDAISKLCGVDSEEEFWAGVNNFKPSWQGNGGVPGACLWQNLKPYPWADLLWNLCEERAPTWVMTSPARSPGSAFGKIEWLQKWKGDAFRRYVIAPNKAHLGKPGALLIDDDPKNVKKWIAQGGQAILFPRLWNDRHERHDRPMETILPELLELEYSKEASE